MEWNKKVIPRLFIHKEDCCGCMACCAICPRSAITMEDDSEGFSYPRINEDWCICCYQCIRVCPIKEAKKSKV